MCLAFSYKDFMEDINPFRHADTIIQISHTVYIHVISLLALHYYIKYTGNTIFVC